MAPRPPPPTNPAIAEYPRIVAITIVPPTSKDGLAYDMDMSVDEAKANAEIVCKNLTLTVNCDGESPLKLYYKIED